MISQAALSEASAYVSMVNIELPLAVSIQSDYVSDRQTRIGLYRRLAAMQNLEEVEAICEELEDRFGSYPETVDNLLYQTRLKILAEKAGLISLTSENGQFVMRYPDGELPESLPDLSPYVRVGKTALWMPFRELLDWQKPLLFVLKKLADPGKP
jgi:transcription-repair coupling factor (superfamily II helicase)